MVYAAYRTGRLLGGVRAARWTAVAAVALSGQPDLELWAAKSESLGVPLVMVSCWLALEALHAAPGRHRYLYAGAAGLAGALAIGMKQNLVGGAVFGVVTLVMALLTGRLTAGPAWRLLVAALAGFLVPVTAVVAWASVAGVELHTLWYALYGFRGEAFSVIREGSMNAPMARLSDLLAMFVGTGMALVVGWFGVCLRAGLRAHPEVAAASLVLLMLDAVALLLGGSYWPPYLSALFPGALLATAVLTSVGHRARRRGMQAAVALCGVSTVLWSIGWTVGHLLGEAAPTAHYVGSAIAEVAAPEDTVVVLYGRPDVVLASGLRSPYPHLWSLPARTLDPELAQLGAVLGGDRAPTWVVVYTPVSSWDLDREGRLRTLLDRRYVEAGVVCGRPVLLRGDVTRPPLPAVDCQRFWL